MEVTFISIPYAEDSRLLGVAFRKKHIIIFFSSDTAGSK